MTSSTTNIFDTIMHEYIAKGPGHTEFELPGAPNFTQYLKEHLEGRLELIPENCAWELQINTILHDGKAIGSYSVKKLADSDDFLRDFRGEIPGYDGDVHLEWANKKYAVQEGKVVLIRSGAWERNDDYLEIMFP